MDHKVVGKSTQRLDAIAKVTGRALYTDDFFERDMLVGKVLRSPHAHAIVTRIDVSRAKALPGVVAVLTPQDLPKIKFATAGHPWSLDPGHRDVEDRLILTDKAGVGKTSTPSPQGSYYTTELVKTTKKNSPSPPILSRSRVRYRCPSQSPSVGLWLLAR